jgi:putative YjhG/YagF family dehydratase
MNHPTVRLFLAGGVPEIAWHLREMGVLRSDARTVTGQTWNEILDQWHKSPRRQAMRKLLLDRDGVDPDQVILPPQVAKEKGLTSTVCFPLGNLCPEGSVIKATSIDPSVVDADGVYRKVGPARVFATEKEAIAAIKGRNSQPIKPGDILVLIGRGPLGSGMEETYLVTSALKHIPWGKHVAVITDARFSGVSTGACIGHVGPEALAGGPIGKLRDGDEIEIIIDRNALTGSINLIGTAGQRLNAGEAAELLQSRTLHPHVRPDAQLPDDTRLWAALQQASGGTWGGCVYDVDRIIELLQAGQRALS